MKKAAMELGIRELEAENARLRRALAARVEPRRKRRRRQAAARSQELEAFRIAANKAAKSMITSFA